MCMVSQDKILAESFQSGKIQTYASIDSFMFGYNNSGPHLKIDILFLN